MTRAGLLRCGKSCRLRWMNYLRPDIKRGNITPEEDDLIIRMHSLLGNRWSLIAGRLPGRTDNEIKNYWNTHLSKKFKTQSEPQQQLQSVDNNNKKKKKKKPVKNNKKNKSNNHNNKVVEDDNDEEDGDIHDEEKKINIYLPKAIRVRSFVSIPRNDSTTTLTLDSNNNGGSSSASGSSSQDHLHEESPELMVIHKEVNYHHDDDGEGFGFFIDQVNQGINTVNFECHSLEKLYDEYFQLLENNNNNNICDEYHQGELDTFAQSLFV